MILMGDIVHLSTTKTLMPGQTKIANMWQKQIHITSAGKHLGILGYFSTAIKYPLQVCNLFCSDGQTLYS